MDSIKKKTKQREAIEKVFHNNKRPLNIDEIFQYGQELVKTLNKATVYRNLKVMVEEKRLNIVSMPGGKNLYELPNKKHHHHFLCRKCEQTFDLPGCPLKKEKLVPKGFDVEEHEVFLFGTCPSCKK